MPLKTRQQGSLAIALPWFACLVGLDLEYLSSLPSSLPLLLFFSVAGSGNASSWPDSLSCYCIGGVILSNSDHPLPDLTHGTIATRTESFLRSIDMVSGLLCRFSVLAFHLMNQNQKARNKDLRKVLENTDAATRIFTALDMSAACICLNRHSDRRHRIKAVSCKTAALSENAASKHHRLCHSRARARIRRASSWIESLNCWAFLKHVRC